MAHFAELISETDPSGFTSDTHLVVKRVVVVDNTHVPSDKHVDGETWCVNNIGDGIWKQTSYNHNFRKEYAGKGMVYNASTDKFLRPQPFASWTLDSSNDWQPPVTAPSTTTYTSGGETKNYYPDWDEDNLRWIAKDSEDTPGNYRWDVDNTEWVSL
tara:strand:+ start:214 stop:684 length:471 start_codon:yes stop_codon:yes gene_type:complete